MLYGILGEITVCSIMGFCLEYRIPSRNDGSGFVASKWAITTVHWLTEPAPDRWFRNRTRTLFFPEHDFKFEYSAKLANWHWSRTFEVFLPLTSDICDPSNLWCCHREVMLVPPKSTDVEHGKMQ